ncbi:fluoride efflux transporter CrcB [Acidiferrobacter sp. SPIII_3]|jgi:CrcB protein|uniref:fluoride efflux transporter FluC n=1 Tax=Acidiferrobacter sp. SPIII_3 TaxID=1281578 RepID=UPI000D72CE64|nr:CrcB family protein [Acidiferrobacter sp. SPIII_3]AWP24054.1 fluoride efflux transporter CrcB [Acidiferrobacter sp. SPIII_3]
MKTLAFIAVFAIFGAIARYLQALVVAHVVGGPFPWNILSINLLGSFAMGFLFFETLERISMSPELRTGLLTGFLGAYTTFSTYTFGALGLIEHGAWVMGMSYLLGSVVLGLAATTFGAWLSRSISGG